MDALFFLVHLLSPCIPSTFAYPILRLPLVPLTPMSYCWLSIYHTTLYFTTVFHFFELFAFRILFDFSVPLVRMFEFHQGTSFYWWPSTTFLYHYCTTSLFYWRHRQLGLFCTLFWFYMCCSSRSTFRSLFVGASISTIMLEVVRPDPPSHTTTPYWDLSTTLLLWYYAVLEF